MNPSQELRLQTLIRTVSETILPAIRDDAPLAREQAGLLMAHLNVMLEQGNRERDVDNHAAGLLDVLAGHLLELSSGETGLDGERGELLVALEKGELPAVSFAVEKLLASTAASPEFKRLSGLEVLNYTKKQNLLGRSWFRGTGFDAAPESLPSIESLLESAQKQSALAE